MSSHYDREVPKTIKKTFAVLEPAIVVFLATVVLGAALSSLVMWAWLWSLAWILLDAMGYRWLPAKEREQPASVEEQLQLDRQIADNTLKLDALMTERLSTETLADERERENDATGRALYVRCVQWTDLAGATQTQTAINNQERACRRFSHYVTTGELLPETSDAQR